MNIVRYNEVDDSSYISNLDVVGRSIMMRRALAIQVKTTDNGRRSRGDMLRTELRILPAGIQLPVLGVVSTTAVGFTIKLRT